MVSLANKFVRQEDHSLRYPASIITPDTLSDRILSSSRLYPACPKFSSSSIVLIDDPRGQNMIRINGGNNHQVLI
jgi:hypothetical protein